MDIFKQSKKDIVIILRKYKGVYKFEKKLRVNAGQEYSYKGKRFVPAKASNWIDKNGTFVHIVDADTTMGIEFVGNANVSFTTSQIDSYIADNMIKNMIKSFGSAISQDKMLAITIFGSGFGIGILIGWIIMVVGAG